MAFAFNIKKWVTCALVLMMCLVLCHCSSAHEGGPHTSLHHQALSVSGWMCAGREGTAAPSHSREDESCGTPMIDYERLEDHGCLARQHVCIDQVRCPFAMRANLQHHVVHWESQTHLQRCR